MNQTSADPALTREDQDHLNLLSIFHFVVGAIIGLSSLFPILHLVLGLGIVSGQIGGEDFSGQGLPGAVFGWFFVLIAAIIIIGGLSLAACIILTGFFLREKSYYTFCLVIAGIECIFMPLGTVLGVFTIIVLMRETVKHRFQQAH